MNKPLFRPVKPFIITQQFGENKICVDLATNSKVISCDGNRPPKGYKSLYGEKGHKGVDLLATHGQRVFCALDGVVEAIDTNPKTGLDVKVKSVLEGRTFLHVYEHLLGYQPKLGDKIASGELIGWADNTGWSSGDHLHFELKELIKGKWVSIDPMPLMSIYHGQDIQSLQEKIASLLELITDLLRKKKTP